MFNAQDKKIIRGIVQAERKRYADYDEECKHWAEQGYRAPYCIHGTSLWTDYDNICGGCEEGYNYFDYMRALRYAVNLVEAARAERVKRGLMIVPIISGGADGELVTKLIDWACEKALYLEKHYA